MSRKLGVMAAALTVVAVMALGPTDALAVKNHSVSATGKAVTIGTQGTTTLAIGRFTGTLGETLVSFKTKVLKDGHLSSTFTAYTRNGTLKGTTVQTVATDANGGSTFTGTAKVIGGTGLYSSGSATGARGTASITGTQPKDNPVISFKLKGSIRY